MESSGVEEAFGLKGDRIITYLKHSTLEKIFYFRLYKSGSGTENSSSTYNCICSTVKKGSKEKPCKARIKYRKVKSEVDISGALFHEERCSSEKPKFLVSKSEVFLEDEEPSLLDSNSKTKELITIPDDNNKGMYIDRHMEQYASFSDENEVFTQPFTNFQDIPELRELELKFSNKNNYEEEPRNKKRKRKEFSDLLKEFPDGKINLEGFIPGRCKIKDITCVWVYFSFFPKEFNTISITPKARYMNVLFGDRHAKVWECKRNEDCSKSVPERHQRKIELGVENASYVIICQCPVYEEETEVFVKVTYSDGILEGTSISKFIYFGDKKKTVTVIQEKTEKTQTKDFLSDDIFYFNPPLKDWNNIDLSNDNIDFSNDNKRNFLQTFVYNLKSGEKEKSKSKLVEISKEKLDKVIRKVIGKVDMYGFDIICHLIAYNFPSLVKYICSFKEVSMNHVDNFENNYLHWSYYYNSKVLIDYFVSKKVDQKKKNVLGIAPSSFGKLPNIIISKKQSKSVETIEISKKENEEVNVVSNKIIEELKGKIEKDKEEIRKIKLEFLKYREAAIEEKRNLEENFQYISDINDELKKRNKALTASNKEYINKHGLLKRISKNLKDEKEKLKRIIDSFKEEQLKVEKVNKNRLLVVKSLVWVVVMIFCALIMLVGGSKVYITTMYYNKVHELKLAYFIMDSVQIVIGFLTIVLLVILFIFLFFYLRQTRFHLCLRWIYFATSMGCDIFFVLILFFLFVLIIIIQPLWWDIPTFVYLINNCVQILLCVIWLFIQCVSFFVFVFYLCCIGSRKTHNLERIDNKSYSNLIRKEEIIESERISLLREKKESNF